MTNKWTIITTVAATVFCILFLWQACKKATPCGDEVVNTVVKADTIVWVIRDTVRSLPILVKSQPITNTVFRDSIVERYNSVDCDSAKQERDELLALYTTQNEYYDAHWIIKTDSLGGKDTLAFIRTIDTVAANMIIGKSILSDIWRKQINTTITNTITKKRNQLYFGVGAMGDQVKPLSLFDASLLLKTKKDNLFGISYTTDLNKQTYYGVRYYKLITFRK